VRLLDLFCGAGGASMGYHRAGFSVVGVDIRPQPRYPFEFVRADALEFVRTHGHEFDVIHASPPCQLFSRLRALTVALGTAREYPDLLDETRRALRALGKPYVIENVPGALLENPVMLCGLMFGLRVFRHRMFEIWPWPDLFFLVPPHPRHPRGATTNAYSGMSGFRHGATHICVTGRNFVVPDARLAMEIEWMTGDELREAIPPAYTEFVGSKIRDFLRGDSERT